MSKEVKEKDKKKPPSASIQSVQYDLFTSFLGEKEKLSNTIELWDSIPKFYVTREKQNKLRDEKGHLPLEKREFLYRGKDCRVVIQPALLEQGDGSEKAFYPSVTEELVEEVLRKIFTDQRRGIHDPNNGESWVRFSLQMIKRELDKRGKKRSITEIKEAIEVLSECKIRFFIDDELIHSEAILSSLTKVSRKQYLEDNSSHWVARLPVLISKSVNELTYRQYDVDKTMRLKEPLSRNLARWLYHDYLNASLTHPKKILLSDIEKNTGFLDACGSITHKVKKLEKALDELKNVELLAVIDKSEIRGARNKILDIQYQLFAHPEFTKFMKRAHVRKNQAVERLEESL